MNVEIMELCDFGGFYHLLLGYGVFYWHEQSNVWLFTLNRLICTVYFSKVITICCKCCNFTACFTINVYTMLLCRWAGTVSSSLLKITSVTKLWVSTVNFEQTLPSLIQTFMSITVVYISSEVMALHGSMLWLAFLKKKNLENNFKEMYSLWSSYGNFWFIDITC